MTALRGTPIPHSSSRVPSAIARPGDDQVGNERQTRRTRRSVPGLLLTIRIRDTTRIAPPTPQVDGMWTGVLKTKSFQAPAGRLELCVLTPETTLAQTRAGTRAN